MPACRQVLGVGPHHFVEGQACGLWLEVAAIRVSPFLAGTSIAGTFPRENRKQRFPGLTMSAKTEVFVDRRTRGPRGHQAEVTSTGGEALSNHTGVADGLESPNNRAVEGMIDGSNWL